MTGVCMWDATGKRNIAFGGNVFLFDGDYRQTLSTITHGQHVFPVDSCVLWCQQVLSSYLLQKIQVKRKRYNYKKNSAEVFLILVRYG